MKALTYDIHPVRWPLCKAAGWVMPRVFSSSLSGLRLRDVPTPSLPNGEWVRLRTALGGICGTDLTTIFQRTHPASILRVMTRFPVVLGHENVAVIEEVGPEVTGWSVGQRVVVESSLSCGPRGFDPPCRSCEAGCFTLCERFLDGPLPPGMMIGWNNFTGGSWAHAFVAHESQLYAVPEGVSDEQAVVVDPIAGAVHTVLRRMPADEERVLVIGGGIIALGVIAAIRALGSRANVTVLARHEHQAARAREHGANDAVISPRSESHAARYERVARAIGGRRIASLFGNQAFIGGYDVVYDCIGTGRSITDAMKFARGRGTVVLAGTSNISVVDTTPLWKTELTIIGCYGRQFERFEGRRLHTYEVVFELARRGRLDLDGWLTHVFALSEYRRAFRLLASPGRSGILKAAFRPD
jgi:threonine 3-dehydrogenase